MALQVAIDGGTCWSRVLTHHLFPSSPACKFPGMVYQLSYVNVPTTFDGTMAIKIDGNEKSLAINGADGNTFHVVHPASIP